MRVFLTGGTGFIGRPLTRALVGRGLEVVALVRRPDGAEARELAAMGARLAPGDVTQRESMRTPMAGAGAVVHNAGIYRFGVSRRDRGAMTAVNVQGTENTLGLAVELGIPRIVHVSTILAFGQTGDAMADETFQRRSPPLSWYERTKTEAHQFATELQRKGAPLIIACPAGVIGPGDHSGVGHLLRMYVRGRLSPISFAADGSRAHVHVEDVAEGVARCVDRGRVGEVYLLSSGVMRHADMFDLWRQTPGGAKRTWLWMSRPWAMLFNRAVEPVERLFGLPMVFCREFCAAAFASWQFTGAKAERELGVRFRPVEQAFLDTLAAERVAAGKRAKG